jgi:hypothetical protein
VLVVVDNALFGSADAAIHGPGNTAFDAAQPSEINRSGVFYQPLDSPVESE